MAPMLPCSLPLECYDACTVPKLAGDSKTGRIEFELDKVLITGNSVNWLFVVMPLSRY
jgi:hypothetical protein